MRFGRPLAFATLLLAFAFSFSSCGAGGERRERREASSDESTTPIAPVNERYFDPEGFPKMPPVRRGDWLDRFEEKRETFAEYRDGDPTGLTKTRRTLVIQPLGEFSKRERALLRTSMAFARAFFQCVVRTESPAPLPPKDMRERSEGGRTWKQYRTEWIFRGQLFPRLPDDAVAFLGVTTQDIYPGPKWNYVFGEAFLDDRIGVYSLARYFPEFWGASDSPEGRRLTVLRTFKVLAHETAHMFGLPHCVDYHCNVNGSNSLAETDSQPLHLCPNCLRKLHWNLQFDLTKRYRELKTIYRREGLPREAAFIERRLRHAEKG